MTGSRTLTVVSGILALVFLVSALLQFNDPDPWRWAAIYALAAVVSGWAAQGRVRWPAPAAVGLASLVWALTLAPRVLGKVGFGELFESLSMQDVRVEQGREMGGLLIVTVWMAVLLLFHRRR